MLGWIDTLLQGILLGGLYSLYATGLSVIFGIMRLVNLAHGDLIVLGAFLILGATSLGVPLVVACAVVVPLMFAVGYALQSVLLNRALGRNILPPLLITFGLSIIVQNGLLETFSADTRRLDVGPLQSASLPLGGGIAIGVMPLICLVSAIARHPAAQRRVLPHRRRPGVPRHVRRCRDRAAHGHQQSLDLRADHGHLARRLRAGGILPRHPRQFRSQHRTGASPLRLRGGHHRRPRQPVGHACRRHRRRRWRRRSARTSIPNGKFSPVISRS